MQTSTYQMGILLLFNNEDSITTEEIHISTQLAEPTLKTTLLVFVLFLNKNLIFLVISKNKNFKYGIRR